MNFRFMITRKHPLIFVRRSVWVTKGALINENWLFLYETKKYYFDANQNLTENLFIKKIVPIDQYFLFVVFLLQIGDTY